MPKNIILLSDGTGNSSAQLLKTNVWRIYESLDLAEPNVQVACYDDGVGTSSFKPLALLGGAIGVGLRGNVLRLYRFLCEHYDDGDRIYLFGFSRGSFTVRVLAGLICSEGVIKTRPTLPVTGSTKMEQGADANVGADDTGAVAAGGVLSDEFAYGSELMRLASRAYREFRKEFNQTGFHVAAARWLRDCVVKLFDYVLGRKSYDRSRNHTVNEIAFIGVWDTVDAYGLPVDELTDGVDRWVWPLSMPDLTLNTKVKRACHVLALDDERNTFHPVLWNEGASKEPQNCTHIDQERITQVWFAGMHSNVGGGYPDDALSAVSFAWMTKQVEKRLKFVPLVLEHHRAKADPIGRLYNSRSGLKSYYRYNPRRIEWLTNGQQHEKLFGEWPKRPLEVRIDRPKIHESVFTRMSAAPEAYAPIVFPQKYGVVMEDGRILDGDANPFEPSDAAKRRVAAQEAVWDAVWWRRVTYFVAVAVTLILALRPFRDGAAADVAGAQFGTASRIVAAIGEWLPSLASPWIEYFTAKPWELFGGVLILLLLSRIGGMLQAKICRTMRGIWLKVIPPFTHEYGTLQPHTSPLKAIRSSKLYQGVYGVLRIRVLPSIFGIVILFWLAALANRIPFEVAGAFGWKCPDGGATTLGVGEPSRVLRLASGDFCTGTGVELEAGKRYELRFAIDSGASEPWQDGGVLVQGGYTPEGFTSRTAGLTRVQRAIFIAFVPFRRVWGADWFVTVARIGEGGFDHYPLDAPTTTIVADGNGELFLFVNDAIFPLNLQGPAWGWDAYYGNNRGTATVTVTRLPDCLEGCVTRDSIQAEAAQ